MGNSTLLRQWVQSRNPDKILCNTVFGLSLTGAHEILVNFLFKLGSHFQVISLNIHKDSIILKTILKFPNALGSKHFG